MKNRVLLILFVLIFGFLCASVMAQNPSVDYASLNTPEHLDGVRFIERQDSGRLGTDPIKYNSPFQEPKEFSVGVFKNQPVNFGGETGDTTTVKRLQNGRVIYRKIKK